MKNCNDYNFLSLNFFHLRIEKAYNIIMSLTNLNPKMGLGNKSEYQAKIK
jgi:hypothetical protein